ncbi:MAG: hypothetical protein AAGB19_21855, partial [Cyanobacteria bacterium P01_F01_bin.3]
MSIRHTQHSTAFASQAHSRTDQSALSLPRQGISGCVGISMQACLRTVLNAAMGVSASLCSTLVGSGTFGLIRSGLAHWLNGSQFGGSQFDGIRLGMRLSTDRPALLPTEILSVALSSNGSDYLNRLEP